MAVSKGRQIVNGGDIMLFVNDGGTYKSIAHGTSHSLSITTSTEQISSKDYGRFGGSEPGQIQFEIQADHMYTRDGWDTFYNKLTYNNPENPNGNQLQVVFGEKKAESYDQVNVDSDGNWTPTSYTSYIYGGTVVVTSLSWSADQGSKSTFSCTLSGVGGIKRLSEINS